MKKRTEETDPLAYERDLTLKPRVRRRDVGKVVSCREMEARNIKVHISIKLDADVLEFFKRRAAKPGAAPYQTQINQALRESMERDQEDFPGSSLLKEERFISGMADRLRKRL
jgi:uncharacterized protein (DUF4415 family)